MVRCDEFYSKWRKAGNFCEKHPATAAAIDHYLDLLPEIENAIENSPLLSKRKLKGEQLITQSASRHLGSCTSDENLNRAIQKIIQKAETKVKRTGKAVVIGNEVRQIVHDIEGPRLKVTQLNRAKSRYARFKQDAEKNAVPIPNDLSCTAHALSVRNALDRSLEGSSWSQVADALVMLDELVRRLQALKI